MKKKIFVGVAAIIILAGAGVVGALFTQTWNPMWNPFRPEPEEVISGMTEKMEALDSFHSVLSLDLREKERNMDITLKSVSDIDQREKENIKEHSDIDFIISLEGQKYPFSSEIILLGETVYLKIKSMPAFSDLLSLIPETPELGEEIGLFSSIFDSLKDEIQGKWIKIDEESIKELYEEMGIPYQKQEFGGLSEAQQKELQEKLTQLLKDKKLYYVEKELPDEKIGKIKVYHYRLVVNKEGLKSLLPEVFETIIEYSSSSLMEEGISPEQVKEVMGEIELPLLIDKIFEHIGDVRYELWIGQKDKYLYRVEASKEIDLQQLKQALIEYLQKISAKKGEKIEQKDIQEMDQFLQGTLSISLKAELSDFNKVGEIKAPDEFLTVKELIQNILQKIFFGMMMQSGGFPEGMNLPPEVKMPSDQSLPVPLPH